MAAKQELIAFLDRKVFDPILRASDADKSDAAKQKLEHVKRATESEKDRYHHYGSADEVKRMFRDDLSSAPAKKIHRESHELGLPTLGDVKDEFDRLCERLGV